MPASERKGDILRFSSVQYILVLHLQLQPNELQVNTKVQIILEYIYRHPRTHIYIYVIDFTLLRIQQGQSILKEIKYDSETI